MKNLCGFVRLQWCIEVLRETRCVIGGLEGRGAAGGFEELQVEVFKKAQGVRSSRSFWKRLKSLLARFYGVN